MQDLSVFMAKHFMLISCMLVISVILALIEIMRMKRALGGLSPLQATTLINHQHAVVIDIREPEAYQAGHIVGAINMPLESIDQQTKKFEKMRKKPLIIVCKQGIAAQKKAAELKQQGYQAHVLAGGMKAWLEASMPTIKE